MMTPRESFEAIVAQLVRAHDTLHATPHDVASVNDQLMGCIVAAHTHAALQAASLIKRERAGALAAMPCITETRQ